MMLLVSFACFLAVGLINSAYVNASEGTNECSPFPFAELDNGEIVRIGNQKYHFKCDKGFVASIDTIRCYNGNWTSLAEPKCLTREGVCNDPPIVPHAVINGDDRIVGSTILYTCKPGFQLIGNGRMTCTRSEHWDGRTPTCMDETEPLKMVADRLKNSFVHEIGSYTADAPEGKLLNRAVLKYGLDLVIIIDRSSSIDPVHLQDAKNFIDFLVTRFGVRNEPNKAGGTQAAVLTFGTNVSIVFNINDYSITGPLAASQAIGTIEPNGGGTNIEGALRNVIVNVVQHLRKKSKKALFLMTDGVPNIANPGISEEEMALQLRNIFNFEIFTLGIGKGINRTILAQIASPPPLSHVFILTEYPELEEIMKIVEDSKPPAPPKSRSQCGYAYGQENKPWLAVLYISGGRRQRKMTMCGGVLICNQWVLTAASCLLDGKVHIPLQNIVVTLGEKDLLRDEKNQTNFYVLNVRLHNRFNPNEPLDNNIALIKLNTPTDRYRPACLPRRDISMPLHHNPKANLSISGWGLNPDVHTHPSGGSVRFKRTSITVSVSEEDACPGRNQNSALFCAGEDVRTCLGLMGSPIIATDPATRLNHVIGVLAGRTHCWRGENQYIELTRYLDWINDHTELCQKKHWDA